MDSLASSFSHSARVRPRSGSIRVAAALATTLLVASCARPPIASVPTRPDLHAFPPALSSAVADAEASVSRAPDVAANRLALGELYHANGFIAEARLCFEPLTREKETAAKACYFLAQLAELSGDLVAERHWLEQTVQRDGSYVPAHTLLADVAYKSGDTAAAVKHFSEALEREPTNAEALLGLARIRLQENNEAHAIALLERAVTAHPKLSTGFALLAQAADRRGEPARAAVFREKSRALKDPARADPWSDEVMARCYDVQRLSLRFEDAVKAGRENDAAAALRRLESVDPKHWVVARMRALAASQRGREDEAVSQYRQAIAAGGDPATLYPALLNSLVSLRRFAEAEETAGVGLRSLPDSPALLVAVGNLRLQQGRVEDAIRLITQALSHDQQNLGANRALARLWWEHGRRDDALPRLEFIRRVAAADVPVRGMLGEYYLEHDQPAAALEPLAEAVALEPASRELRETLALAHLRVANQHARQRQFTAAVAAYDQAITVRPDYVEARANRIQVCAAAGWLDRAARDIPALLALQPMEPSLYLKIGDVAQAAGDPVAALDCWNRGMRLLDQAPNAPLRDAFLTRLSRSTTVKQ